jgi:hypothetical protein
MRQSDAQIWDFDGFFFFLLPDMSRWVCAKDETKDEPNHESNSLAK